MSHSVHVCVCVCVYLAYTSPLRSDVIACVLTPCKHVDMYWTTNTWAYVEQTDACVHIAPGVVHFSAFH